ncbi:MAG TPA: protein kinase, partial [Vicinamibacteria bacterium]
MARKEKFGKLVLLEEMEGSALFGAEYRAAKLGVSGLEKIVTLLRLRPEICSHTEAARSLMDQVKLAAQLQNPNIIKVFGIGKVESSYYITYEFVEGRSLQQILDHCRQEHYPFAVDHALLIASKVCAALEYAHSRRNDAGARTFHGLLTPDCVLVSYEGEVRLRGFGYWPSQVRHAGLLHEDERRYLAPEQRSDSGDPRSDLFGVGAILFETLTGQPPAAGTEAATLLASARLLNPTGDDDSVPKPIAEILLKTLALDPAARYAEIGELRKAIDTLLFSGDFTPTTFNLAFFMHSLFREDMEREARALKEEREGSYAEYLAEDGARAGAAARPSAAARSKTEPIDLRQIASLREEVPAHPDATVVEAPDTLQAHAAHATPVPAHEPAPAHPPHASSPGLSPREAASSFTFHKDEKPKGKPPLLAGAAAVALLAAAGGGYYFLQVRGASPVTTAAAAPVPTTLSPEVLAAQERVKELEQKLAALEAEKLAAESKAADDAKQKVEAQAKAKGQEVDQAALAKAQEEARQKARQEEERKQREELRRVEEQKRAEEARLAEERRRAEEAAALERVAQERAAAERAAEQA